MSAWFAADHWFESWLGAMIFLFGYVLVTELSMDYSMYLVIVFVIYCRMASTMVSYSMGDEDWSLPIL